MSVLAGPPALPRPWILLLALMPLCRPALGGMRPPKQISEKSLHAAWRYFTHKDLDLLGDWRLDKDFLRELNGKLVSQQIGIIDNFFKPELAEMLHNESVHHFTRAKHYGNPMENTPVALVGGLKEYNAHVDPNERCGFLAKTLDRDLSLSYHILDGPEILESEELKLPGRMAVQKLFRQRKWIKAWTILLTGTDKGVDDLSMSPPSFREYRQGDYINFHNDMVKNRRLCFNYWTPSPDWDPDWGGSFVWCGTGYSKSGGRMGDQSEEVIDFPKSFRVRTRYNQVGMFVPQMQTWHAVDRVGDAVGPSRHRFSFTSWLEEGQEQIRRDDFAKQAQAGSAAEL